MSRKLWCVWIGFDPREAAAFAVARESIRQWHQHIPIRGVVLSDLQDRGLYYRPTRYKLGRLWDDISGAHMSTEFAISRFLVPALMASQPESVTCPRGWAIFMDCDVLVRTSLNPMIAELDDDKALYCVKHKFTPTATKKMDGQVQTQYERKNWSSVMAFNCDHQANKALTVEMVNTLPGRDLHRFCWLDDDEIGELDPSWNYLVGHTQINEDPRIVHWTDGYPGLSRAFHEVEFSDEWFAEIARWAR